MNLRLIPVLLVLSPALSPAAEPFDAEGCAAFFTESLRKMNLPPEGAVKFRAVFGETPPVSQMEAHHLKGMLGEYRDQVNLGPWASARSILLLGDGSSGRTLDRLGPLLAREMPGKTVVSADVDVIENRLLTNWGHVRIDHRRQFPVKDNSFDRVVLRRGLCQCHSGACCAGFDPHGHDAKHFFREVIRVLNKDNPEAFAVLHGMHNVGGEDVRIWKSMLEELSRFYPFEYRIVTDRGFFHSILIRPRAPTPR